MYFKKYIILYIYPQKYVGLEMMQTIRLMEATIRNIKAYLPPKKVLIINTSKSITI